MCVTMSSFNIGGVLVTPLKVIDTSGGDVLHGMKRSDIGFSGFGEAYFSTVEQGVVRAWKLHRKMTLNLVVPLGAVRFIVYDNRQNSSTNGKFQEVVLSRKNYCRLTIPPMLWVGFQGTDNGTNILLNIADIMHIPEEVDTKDMNGIEYNWEVIK